MGMQRTAPAGYGSNSEFFLDLMSFGYGIWGKTGMAVIHFHVERSIRFGRRSDQHSRSQAINGIYSEAARKWIRGPAGISNGTWISENTALLIDPTNPQTVEYVDVFREEDGCRAYSHSAPKERPRVLRSVQRFTKHGGRAATEYEVDSLAVKAAIEEWQAAQKRPDKLPLLDGTSSTPLTNHWSTPLTNHWSTPRPTTGQPLTNHWSTPDQPLVRGEGVGHP